MSGFQAKTNQILTKIGSPKIDWNRRTTGADILHGVYLGLHLGDQAAKKVQDLVQTGEQHAPQFATLLEPFRIAASAARSTIAIPAVGAQILRNTLDPDFEANPQVSTIPEEAPNEFTELRRQFKGFTVEQEIPKFRGRAIVGDQTLASI